MSYTLETIRQHFDTVTKGHDFSIKSALKAITEYMIINLPDNEAKDFAISHMLEATHFVFGSYVLQNHERKKHGI